MFRGGWTRTCACCWGVLGIGGGVELGLRVLGPREWKYMEGDQSRDCGPGERHRVGKQA